MPNEKFPVVHELERIFQHFNKGLYDNQLALPVHVLRPDKKLIFQYSANSKCVVIGSKFSECNEQEMLENYIHEMVHIRNSSRGIVDQTTNDYHNRQFLNAALYVGLHVAKHPTKGWALTQFHPWRFENVSPSHFANDRRRCLVENLLINDNILKEGKKYLRKLIVENKPKPCFLKYVCDCPPPHNSIRTGRRPNSCHAPKITCKVCNGDFQCVK